jgi:hypothetical protein
VVALSLGVLVILTAIPAAAWYLRVERARRAREETIPAIARLVSNRDFIAAFDLARRVQDEAPNDPMLAELWPQFSAVAGLVSVPAGADVYIQPYDSDSRAWEHLGRTPIQQMRLPRGVFRLRIEKTGFIPRVIAERNPGARFGNKSDSGAARDCSRADRRSE